MGTSLRGGTALEVARQAPSPQSCLHLTSAPIVPTQALMIHTASHPGHRSRRDARDLQRRAVVQGRGARGPWWYRLRGIVGLIVITIASAIVLAGAVLAALALTAYLIRSFSG